MSKSVPVGVASSIILGAPSAVIFTGAALYGVATAIGRSDLRGGGKMKLTKVDILLKGR